MRLRWRPATWARALAAAVLFLSTVHAGATVTGERLRSLELASVDDPNGLLSRSRTELQAAIDSGDEVAQMWGWCGVMLGEQMLEADAIAEEAAAREGARLAVELNDEELLSVFLIGQAIAAQRQDRPEEALERFDVATRLVSQPGLETALGRVLNQKATVLMDHGRHAEALALLFQARRLFYPKKDRHWRAVALGNIATIYMHVPARDGSNWDKAIRYYEQVLAEIDPKMYRIHGATLHQLPGVAYYKQGRHADARRHWAECERIAALAGDKVQAAQCAARLARLALSEENVAEATALLDRSHPVFERTGNTVWLWTTHMIYAELHARQRQPERSLSALESAQAITRRLGVAEREAEFHERAAEVLRQLGRFDQALRHVQQLRQAEQRRAAVANDALVRQLTVAFDVRQVENDNEILRVESRQAQAEQQVWLLIAGTLASLVAMLSWSLASRYRRERRLAQEAELSKSRFVSAACHDMNQPTQALNMYLWLLADNELPAEDFVLLCGAAECGRALDERVQSLMLEASADLRKPPGAGLQKR